MGLFGKSNLFSTLTDMSSVVTLVIFLLVVLGLMIIVRITNIPVTEMLKKIGTWIFNKIAKKLHKKEKTYHRNLEIGKINEKRANVKLYRLLTDLIIDLNMSDSHITPYELLFLVITATTIVTGVLCKVVFDNLFMLILMDPIAIVGVFSVLYTKANLAHDARIEAIIEAENIICNNIKIGVVPAVRDNIETIPKLVRPEFIDFLDNMTYKSTHIKTALQDLNNKLGSVSDDFIDKCITFELEEEHGSVGIFQDVVEINTVKLNMRKVVKRKFEEITNEYRIGASMVLVFLGFLLVLYDNIRAFYFTTVIGQLIIALDALILIGEFVFITYLKAQEL